MTRGMQHRLIATTSGAAGAAFGLAGSHLTAPDWLVASTAGRTLLSARGLAVYALHPRAQEGPLALALAALPRPVYAALIGACLGVFVWLAGYVIRTPLRLWATAAVMFLPWWRFAVEGHADDALVILAALVMLTHRRHAGPAFAVAVLAKPTGLLLAPLLTPAALPVAALGVAGYLSFLPYGLLHAGAGASFVWRGSLAHLIGYPIGAAMPAWTRPAQLVAGLTVGWLLVRRGRPAEAMLAAFTIRTLLEPVPWPGYVSTVIAFALVAERLPWRAAVAWLAWRISHGSDPDPWLRTVLLAGVLVSCYPRTRAAARRSISGQAQLVGVPDPAGVRRGLADRESA